jgi:cytochrome oxidase Cu insertion factor (SCO1/SenC/PrrC family)
MTASTETPGTPETPSGDPRLWRWLALGIVLLAFVVAFLTVYSRLPKPLADIPMTNHHGKTVRLSDYRGKWLIVYFGYTGCPDACPTGLGEIAKALQDMGPDRDVIQPIFISLDPKNDTPERLSKYLPYFDPAFIGHRVEEPALSLVAKQFGVTYVTAESSTYGTIIDHSLHAYLVDPGGVRRDSFATTFPPDFLRKRLMQHGWKGAST